MLGDGGVVDEVLRQEVVEDVQIVIVIDLLHQPADDGLVLFCRHSGLPSVELCNEGIIAAEPNAMHHTKGLYCPIHPSAWKRNSANFAGTEFYEVRLYHILGSPMLGVLQFLGHDRYFHKPRSSCHSSVTRALWRLAPKRSAP